MDLQKRIAQLVARFYLRNAYMGDWIAERYLKVQSYIKLIFNQLIFLIRSDITPFLLSVNIDPINRCNLKCKSCRGYYNFPPMDDGMSLDLFRRIISEIPRSVENINLSMFSEPLLHPQIFEMIKITALAGFRPTIFTNGTLITEEVANRLLQSPLDSISVSMEVDEQNSLEWRGTSQKKMEKTLIRLIRLKKISLTKVKIKISLIAHQSNVSNIRPFIKKWATFVDGFKVSPMIIRKRDSDKNPCSELWRGNLTIFSNGECIPCCGDFQRELTLGSLKTNSIHQIWNGNTMKKLRQEHRSHAFPDVCRNCTLDESAGIKRFKN